MFPLLMAVAATPLRGKLNLCQFRVAVAPVVWQEDDLQVGPVLRQYPDPLRPADPLPLEVENEAPAVYVVLLPV